MEHKYLKYKNKYLNIKNEKIVGGEKIWNLKFSEIKKNGNDSITAEYTGTLSDDTKSEPPLIIPKTIGKWEKIVISDKQNNSKKYKIIKADYINNSNIKFENLIWSSEREWTKNGDNYNYVDDNNILNIPDDTIISNNNSTNTINVNNTTNVTNTTIVAKNQNENNTENVTNKNSTTNKKNNTTNSTINKTNNTQVSNTTNVANTKNVTNTNNTQVSNTTNVQDNKTVSDTGNVIDNAIVPNTTIVDNIPNVSNITEIDNNIYKFIGGEDNGVSKKIDECYSENNWASNPYNKNNIFFYYKNTNDIIVSIVRINTTDKEFDYDYTLTTYRRKKLWQKLNKYRFEYYLKNYNEIVYNLYTEYEYLKKEHLNLGLFLISNIKDDNHYWRLKTIMEDGDLGKRLEQDKIKNTIYDVSQCVITQIKKNNGNNYFLSAFHCCIKNVFDNPGYHDEYDSKMIDIDMQNKIDITGQFLVKKKCKFIDLDIVDEPNNISNESIDIIIYSGKSNSTNNAVSAIIWDQKSYDFNNKINNLRYIVYNKFIKEFIYLKNSDLEYINKFPFTSINDDISNCYWIKVKISLDPGNSGGPLFVYVKDKFYLMGILSNGGGNGYAIYSPLCNINKTMDPEFFTKFNFVYSNFEFNNIDKVNDDDTNKILNNFTIIQSFGDFK
jgi:hypothetical protein